MNKLKIINGLLYFAKWVFIAIVLVAVAMLLFMNGEPMIISSPTISIADEDLQNSLDAIITSVDGMTLSVDGISAQAPATWTLQLLGAFTLIIHATFILWALQIIINIVQDVKNKDAFTAKNITRLKRISLLLILLPFLFSATKFVDLLVISSEYNLPDTLTYSWVDNTSFDLLAIGFLLYAIAIAFGEGLKMKNENELTI